MMARPKVERHDCSDPLLTSESSMPHSPSSLREANAQKQMCDSLLVKQRARKTETKISRDGHKTARKIQRPQRDERIEHRAKRPLVRCVTIEEARWEMEERRARDNRLNMISVKRCSRTR